MAITKGFDYTSNIPLDAYNQWRVDLETRREEQRRERNRNQSVAGTVVLGGIAAGSSLAGSANTSGSVTASGAASGASASNIYKIGTAGIGLLASERQAKREEELINRENQFLDLKPTTVFKPGGPGPMQIDIPLTPDKPKPDYSIYVMLAIAFILFFKLIRG